MNDQKRDPLNGKALGIIETVGLVPVVEAGDVAVKTADVSILGSQAVGGGLVSILMTGDVSAVKASVDAGSAAAARLGQVCAVTVIARTADGLSGILIEEAKRPKCVPQRSAPVVATQDVPPETDGTLAPAPPVSPEARCDDGAERPGGEEPLSFDMADLKKMKVTKLRRLARQLPSFSIARGEIKYAKKRDLLEAFIHYMKTLNP